MAELTGPPNARVHSTLWVRSLLQRADLYAPFCRIAGDVVWRWMKRKSKLEKIGPFPEPG